MSLKVIVSGAGVAGLALSHWLARIGATTILVERAPRFQALGAGRPPGIGVRAGSAGETLRRPVRSAARWPARPGYGRTLSIVVDIPGIPAAADAHAMCAPVAST
jgi:2-polyprenyl-6-methoxyphenol hydroxylase-like FAD-dependent oxidoreductase